MDLSIIVPLYNEEESIPLLYQKIIGAVEKLPLKFEILFVDDGSKDSSFHVASAIAAEDKRLKVVRFRKNYGQTPAMAAGIDQAQGKILITMDGDLQNDPDDIPNFIAKINEGFDIVVGWRFNRQDKLVSRKIPSKIANWIIGKVTGVPIKDNGCSLKAFRSHVIKSVPLYSEMHRFIPAMASIAGPRIAEIKVKHHARQFGQSKYGLSRIYKVLLDLLTIKTIASFSARPLLWFAALSLPFALISAILIVTTLYKFVLTGSVLLPLIGSGMLLGALALFLMFSGVIAELLYKTGDINMSQLSLLTATRLSSVKHGHGQLVTESETNS